MYNSWSQVTDLRGGKSALADCSLVWFLLSVVSTEALRSNSSFDQILLQKETYPLPYFPLTLPSEVTLTGKWKHQPPGLWSCFRHFWLGKYCFLFFSERSGWCVLSQLWAKYKRTKTLKHQSLYPALNNDINRYIQCFASLVQYFKSLIQFHNTV